jgi:hypothetical protein
MWFWFLDSLKDFLITFFLPFLPQHVDMGLARIITSNAGPILGLVFITAGSFVHLATLFRIIGLMMLIESVRALIAFRKIMARLIKLATLIGLLG